MAPIVLITGADGFVGRHMVAALAEAGCQVRCAQRSPCPAVRADTIGGLELGPATDWRAALRGVDAVVHLAARAHRSRSVQERESDLYHRVNVEGTLQLARSAAAAGVRRFIFMSSVAVKGSTTEGRRPFCEQDGIAPKTVYGKTKAAAERGLAEMAAKSAAGTAAMSITVIRTPMIFGSGAVGNFGRLLSAVRAGVPLPFGLVDNRRAFLGIDNLTSFVRHRLSAPTPTPFEMFLLADDEQVSTPQFIRLLARASGRPARLLPIPLAVLRAPMSYLGLSDALIGSLEVDAGKAKAAEWRCPLSLAEGLARAVATLPALDSAA